MYIVFVECLFYGYYHTSHLDLGFVFLRLDFSCSWFKLSITHQFVQLCRPMSSCSRPRKSGNDIFQLEWILLTFYIWNWVIKYKDVYKVCLLTYFFPTGFINVKITGTFSVSILAYPKPKSFRLFGIQPQTMIHLFRLVLDVETVTHISNTPNLEDPLKIHCIYLIREEILLHLYCKYPWLSRYHWYGNGNPDVWVMAPLQVINDSTSFKSLR